MSNIKLFQSKQIRTHWDEEKETWYFSVVDVVEVLTDSQNPRRYWSDLKRKLSNEGSQLYADIVQLKMKSSDGKYYKTDVADTQQLLRIIQSIPSPKAEPFKMWLAKVGYERIQEVGDPEQSLNRARENWQKLGRSEKWIQQRMAGQETRNKLTDYWKESGVGKSNDFAYLTNLIHQEWADLSIKQHKELKGLKRENLRDHMSEAELIFTALAELSSRQIAETEQAKGVRENAVAGKKGGKIAKDARQALELKTGKSVITSANFLPPTTSSEEIEE